MKKGVGFMRQGLRNVARGVGGCFAFALGIVIASIIMLGGTIVYILVADPLHPQKGTSMSPTLFIGLASAIALILGFSLAKTFQPDAPVSAGKGKPKMPNYIPPNLNAMGAGGQPQDPRTMSLDDLIVEVESLRRQLEFAKGQVDEAQQGSGYKKLHQQYEQLKRDSQAEIGELRRQLRDMVPYSQLQQVQMRVSQLEATLRDSQNDLAVQRKTNDLRAEETERLRKQVVDLRAKGGGQAAMPVTTDAPAFDPPEYKVEETEHPHLRHQPSNGTFYPLVGGWQAIGASRRGRGHEQGKWRDDDFVINGLGQDLMLVAIADGVGSKPLSRWGARAAVLGAVQILKQESAVPKLIQAVQGGQMKMRDILAQSTILAAMKAAKDGVLARAQQARVNPDELHSTLLVFLAVPHLGEAQEPLLYVASAQVGDGALYTRPAPMGGQPNWHPLEVPQISGVNNEVEPFLRSDERSWEKRIHTYDLEPGSFLMGMTDGTIDDLELAPDENGLFNGYEDFYQRIVKESLSTATPAQGLENFLGYRKRQSFDDRTLVCIYQPPQGGK
jgi:hypothetical protein